MNFLKSHINKIVHFDYSLRYRIYCESIYKRVAVHTKYILFSGLLISLLAACGNDRMSNKEMRKALGIVDGQSNELRIGGVLYRFPPEFKLVINASEKRLKENKDAVNKVIFHMDLSSWFDPPPTARGEGNSLVRIEIRAHGYEDSAKQTELLEKDNWASQRDIPEWGLREYISIRFPKQSGWGDLSYRAINLSTPKGGPIIYRCTTLYRFEKENIAKPDQCMTPHQTIRGPMVNYVLSGKLLPRWKEVHAEVLALVNSLIVE